MNVKISYGKAFNAIDIKQKEEANKIALLERNMIEKDKEVSSLKGVIADLKCTIKKMDEDHNAISKQRGILAEELKAITNQNQKITDNMISSSKYTNDLIESNQKLQLEIEKLNLLISSKNKAENKINEEYNHMTKVKNGFEDKIIALSYKIEDLSAKVVSYEQMIKQKDKYIQMLVNNKRNNTNTNLTVHLHHDNNNTSNRLQQVAEPSYHKDTATNLQTDPIIINNIILLKDKLTEKESTINHLNEQIKALKKDNGNLIIRLKNSTSNSTLMKKAI